MKSKSGFVRQEVVTGPSNDLNICIGAGLKAGDELSINAPTDGDKTAFAYLSPVDKQTAVEKLEKAKSERVKIQQEVAKTIKAENLSGDSDEGGSFIIF